MFVFPELGMVFMYSVCKCDSDIIAVGYTVNAVISVTFKLHIHLR